MKYIEISSAILLDRFRVGVKTGEIKPFNVIIEDIDGKIYKDTCTEKGKFDGDAYNAQILDLYSSNLDKLIDCN